MSGHDNKFPGEDNTGHFWDDEQDLRELNNRPPRWYMIALYMGLVAIVGYAIYYPSIPWFGNTSKGYSEWTQVKEMNEDISKLTEFREKRYATHEKDIASKSLDEILQSEKLTTYSVKTAKTLFGDNCSACHGSGGQGNEGFPVLADDDWLYGGKPQQILTSISNGRKGNMPARMMGISDDDANTLADALIRLSTGDIKSLPPLEKGLYLTKGCIGCHGPTLKGNIYMGAVNLSDSIYRFRADDQKQSYVDTILYGVNQSLVSKSRHISMPSFKNSEVITDVQLKKLAIYVHQLGGGQ
jgi:cytochrome c oxidase cbb3-type subunit 3